jgi:hypothetical protein
MDCILSDVDVIIFIRKSVIVTPSDNFDVASVETSVSVLSSI